MEYVDAIQHRLNWQNGAATGGLLLAGKELPSATFAGGQGNGKIGTTGFILGWVGGFHAALVVLSLLLLLLLPSGQEEVAPLQASTLLTMLHWSIYMSLLCLFHFAEFFVTAVCQPSTLSYDSFIVNHSNHYTLAALASWAEFWLETAIFGRRKHNTFCMLLGLVLVLGGQGVRTVAMWTCGEHFSHQIMEQRRDGHRLITHGIYGYLRHPSYFGWFYWSVGTQLLLCNPVCITLYAAASWSFFSSRIPYEEECLLRFYRQQYVDYARKTVVGIPFIKSVAAQGDRDGRERDR